jgi:hypothetical protein
LVVVIDGEDLAQVARGINANTNPTPQFVSQKRKGAAARRQTVEELASPWGGAPDAGPVLREFPKGSSRNLRLSHSKHANSFRLVNGLRTAAPSRHNRSSQNIILIQITRLLRFFTPAPPPIQHNRARSAKGTDAPPNTGTRRFFGRDAHVRNRFARVLRELPQDEPSADTSAHALSVARRRNAQIRIVLAYRGQAGV